ncbi:Multidrug resistance protein B [Chromobacterium violaceum]|uniref:Multidrug resistance protein B n=1 Tax=Chromobacterium violaceum TaxID=536 RepID=A0A447T6Z7_CHRVL|nr:Multidrug resistance protein B [Chromobacterium violaceum]
MVLLPLMLQTQLGYTATWPASPRRDRPDPGGAVADHRQERHRWDMRWIVTVSFSVYAICFFWRSTFNTDMDFSYVVWPQVVQGIGVACFFMPLTTITLSGLHPSRIASASSLSNFLRILAGSIGTSITTTMWDRREAQHHSKLTEHVTQYDPASVSWFDTMASWAWAQPAARADQLQITKQGYIMAANEIFWVSGVLFVLLIGLVWFAKPPFTASAATAARTSLCQNGETGKTFFRFCPFSYFDYPFKINSLHPSI